jgi:hypothetical protein
VGPESGHSSKTWSYAYDKNNNMTSESFPRPAVALAGDYSNTMAYDALDRMTSRLVGKRSLVAADEALFGSRTYSYSWDEGPKLGATRPEFGQSGRSINDIKTLRNAIDRPLVPIHFHHSHPRRDLCAHRQPNYWSAPGPARPNAFKIHTTTTERSTSG